MQPDENPPAPGEIVYADSAPPLLSPQPIRKSRLEWGLCLVLSLFVVLFFADAVVSFLDDSLNLLFNVYALAPLRGFVFLLTFLMAVVVYALMALTPMIPKRWFLPLTLFVPVAALLMIPFAIYFFGWIQQISLVISLCQIILGLMVLGGIQGGLKFRWPLIAGNQLWSRRFNWRNLSLFVLANIFVLLPVVGVYLAVCSAVAVNHFSDGFLALRPGGLTVQVRNYVKDGKTIQLVPMAHVGDSAFYQKLSQSFPTNSIVLMEGVTDDQNLLTNKVSYERMAKSLGLSEQQEEFQPRGEVVHADLDVADFSPETIRMLNVIMLIHAKGVNPETVAQITQYAPPPHFEKQLFDDLLKKRNRYLLGEIKSRLAQWDEIIVPWGAAHIPELATEIQKDGFKLSDTREYKVIEFGFDRNKKLKEGKPNRGTSK